MDYPPFDRCVIYQPSLDVSQSGTRKMWIIRPNCHNECYINPITGWVASDNAANHLCLSFDTLDEAVTYAESNGIVYTVRRSNQSKIKKKAYQDNFLPRSTSR